MREKPKQMRAKKNRQALMSALESLLKEKDFDQISVTDIASVAGVSTGLLYAHFKNKADFLEALLDVYKARILARLEEVESQDVKSEYQNAGGLREALRIIASYAYTQLLEEAHIIRALSQHLRARPDEEQAQWQALRLRAASTITSVLDVYADDLARTDKSLTATTLVYFFNSIFSEALQTIKLGQASDDHLSQEAFTQEIADIAFGYLTTAPQGSG